MNPSKQKTFLGIGCALGALLLTQLGTPLQRELSQSPLLLPLASLLLQSIFILLALAGASLSPESPGQRLGFSPPAIPLRDIGLLVLGMLGVSHALDCVVQLAGLGESGTLAEFESATRHARGGALCATVIGMAIAPAFGEEMLFRGLIQRGLTPLLGEGRALLLAAFLFGLVHFDPVQGPAAGLLGLYLGTVLLRTRSLWPAILCHACNNFIAVVSGAVNVQVAHSPWAIPLGLGLAAYALHKTRRIAASGPTAS